MRQSPFKKLEFVEEKSDRKNYILYKASVTSFMYYWVQYNIEIRYGSIFLFGKREEFYYEQEIILWRDECNNKTMEAMQRYCQEHFDSWTMALLKVDDL